MNLLFKILSVIAAMAAGSAITMYVMNKKDGETTDCGILLAKNRKQLINKMNKDIEEVEKRTSAENHAKMQRDLENMDWNGGACSY